MVTGLQGGKQKTKKVKDHTKTLKGFYGSKGF